MTITRDDITLAVAIIGALTGIAGLCLGLFNLWITWRKERISLKVNPTFLLAFPAAGGFVRDDSFVTTRTGKKVPKVWGVEITNKGAKVKIKEVGFLSRGTTDRAVITKQWLPCYHDLPLVLEAHDSISIFADAMTNANTLDYAGDYKCAFARTASGKYFTGTSSGLRLHSRTLRKAREIL